MNETTNPRDLAVGDAEREHVMALLQTAVGRGLLDVAEFDLRADAVVAAATRAELNRVLVDIPGAEAAPDRMDIRGDSMATITRTGRWVVPRELHVRNRWARTDLDLTEARIHFDEIHVVLDMMGGPTVLTLPKDAVVTIDGLDTAWGATVDNKLKRTLTSGRPHVVVSGLVRLGPLTIRGPKR